MNRDILKACELRIAERVDPVATVLRKGDVWRAKDGRLIVIHHVVSGDHASVYLYINGDPRLMNVDQLPFYLLSLEAEPLGRVERGKM